MTEIAAESKRFTTSDGVELHYFEAGQGRPLVMVPGWSQAAEEFREQIGPLSEHARVIAVDMRGHGRSAKPEFGYRVHRLARDLRELLVGLDLEGATLLGHSMGCSVIWAYWDLWGGDRLSKLVLVDQSPCLIADPNWSVEERLNAGTLFTPASTYETVAALAGPDGEAATRVFIGSMLTATCPTEIRDWIIACNLQMPRQHAATLIRDHIFIDWRDLIPRIDVPALAIGGRVSIVPWQSVAWTAAQVPGGAVEIFEESEGGNHFMFVENPEKFNRLVAAFLG